MLGHTESVLHHCLIGTLVLDELVCGQDHHDGVGIAGRDEADSEGNSGSGIPLRWLCKDVIRGQHRGILADCFSLQLIGQDEDVFQRDKALEALDGLLEKGAGAEEIEQLFRPRISAEWPEAGAGAAGEDEGVSIIGRRHNRRELLQN